MVEFLAAFVTGLTAGGLSCLAVQGGLLTGSIAPPASNPAQAGKKPVQAGRKPAQAGKKPAQAGRKPVQAGKKPVQAGKKPVQAGKQPVQAGKQPVQAGKKPVEAGKQASHRSKPQQPVTEPPTARTILLFLAAKLVAYALLGLLIGALGSVLQLTPRMSALLMLVIGVFMVGNGLRMLNVHPIFRYFTFEPPSAVTRYLRRKAKGDATAVTPVFLGALTVLIPCGVTQAMMALAMGTGDALRAAGLMISFTLGSSVVFFIVGYLALRLGGVMQKGFGHLAAVVLLVLGFTSVNSGMNLLGVPLSFLQPVRSAAQEAEAVTILPTDGEPNVITIQALGWGYEPRRVHAPAGVPTELTFVSENLFSCSRALVIPEWNIREILPETGEFTVSLPAQPPGKVLNYSCSMGMYFGQIVFDQ